MGERNFPVILWEVISKENKAIKWEKCGTKIVIDFEELDKYLQSSESILPMRNQMDFVLELFHWRFRRSLRKKGKDVKEEFPEIYSNQFFRRNNSNLLTLITPMERVRKIVTIFGKENHLMSLRERDPCFQIVRKLPRMERDLNHLATVVTFERSKRNFKKQLDRKRILTLALGSTSWKEQEEESKVDGKINVGEMAGSYGLEDTVKLKNFLGPYIPTYALQNTDTFPPNFTPQATSSQIWDTPLLESSAIEVHEVTVNTFESEIEELTLSGAEIHPEDKTEDVPDNHDVSQQLQESFNVLYNG